MKKKKGKKRKKEEKEEEKEENEEEKKNRKKAVAPMMAESLQMCVLLIKIGLLVVNQALDTRWHFCLFPDVVPVADLSMPRYGVNFETLDFEI